MINLDAPSDVVAAEALALAESIHPLFAGKSPDLVSAALVELVARWLAGHQGDNVALLRSQLLGHFMDAVHELVPEIEKELQCHK